MVRRVALVCLEVAAGTLVVAALALAGSAWRLSQGPVSLGFLVPYADGLLHPPGTPVRVAVDDVRLAWAGWERAVELRAFGVHLIGDGETLSHIGEVAVSLSFRALLAGKVAPTSLRFIHPRVWLVREEGGEVEFGLRKAGGEPAPDAGLASSLLNELSGAPRSGSRFAYLDRVGIVGGVLHMEDRKLDAAWDSGRADLTVRRTDAGLAGSFHMRPGAGSIAGDLDYDAQLERVDLRLDLDEVAADPLFSKIGKLTGANVLRARISGHAAIRVGTDGRVQRSSFRLTGGEGEVDGPFPFAFRSFDLTGETDRNELRVADARFDLDGGTATVKAVLARVGGIATMNATVEVPEFPLKDLYGLWPTSLARPARNWVTANITEGAIRDAAVAFTARMAVDGEAAGEAKFDSFNGRFALHDASIEYLARLPPVRGVDATAAFSGERIDFAVQGGRLGEISIGDGAVSIEGIGAPQESMKISVAASGPVVAALDLLAHPRLALLSRADLRAAAGAHSTRLRFEFPLLAALTADDMVISAESEISGFVLRDAFAGRPVENGAARLDLEDGRMRIEGEAEFVGAPTRFSWFRDFASADGGRLEGRLTLTDAHARMLGADAVARGRAPTRFVYRHGASGGDLLAVEIDFSPAALTLPGFGWSKAPGRPGEAGFTAELADGRFTGIPSFAVRAGDFRMSGRQTRAAGETVLEIDGFAVGRTSARARIREAPTGELVVELTGEAFDAMPLIDGMDGESAIPDLGKLALSGRFAKFWIGSGPPLEDVQIRLERDAGEWRVIRLRGAVSEGGKRIAAAMTARAGGHDLKIVADDAGALFAALGFAGTVRGGAFDLTARREAGAAWKGTVGMKRFRIADAPAMARLLTMASLSGIGDLLQGRGIAFSAFTMPFAYRNGAATISEAHAIGSELGLTVSGRAGRDNVDLRGLIVPAYTLNSLLRKIPFLGKIIAGGGKSGVFAAPFRARGSIDALELSVNPLSLLAPGILRKLLDGLTGFAPEKPGPSSEGG